ncbi:MAG: TIM barrel protein [Verrucomicrobiota bacterium]
MKLSRRSVFKSVATALPLAAMGGLPRAAQAEEIALYRARKGRIKQSIVPWCYKPLTVEELAALAVKLGMHSIELCDPKFWPKLKELGLTCAIAGSHGFGKGFAHLEEHELCLKSLTERIGQCVTAGVPSIITFSGFRRGLATEVGVKNMVDGLKKIAPIAEKAKVTVCLEMLNSRVNVEMKGHPDYFCDSMDLSVDILKQVSSEYVKVLFDIYHVQIMHGDVITRLKQYAPWIGHYHTAGVPGRNEIDDTQELCYAPIMRAIVATGYRGYVGQEFIPVGDKVKSLSDATRICDV